MNFILRADQPLVEGASFPRLTISTPFNFLMSSANKKRRLSGLSQRYGVPRLMMASFLNPISLFTIKFICFTVMMVAIQKNCAIKNWDIVSPFLSHDLRLLALPD